MDERVILSADDVRRIITRIAHEIVENNRGAQQLLLVGMRTRGVPFAERIAAGIHEFEGIDIPVGALDIGLYRDDLSSLDIKPRLQRTSIPVDVTGQTVVLVDDVLFTGRSIRAALDAIMDHGRPRRILLAVLIDRGHRELPVRADFVGKNVPTARNEDVQVRFSEVDGEDQVVLTTTAHDLRPEFASPEGEA